MTLPHPQAHDLLARCSEYRAGEIPLINLRVALGEAATRAEGDLRETLADATARLDDVDKDLEPGSTDEHGQADSVVSEVETALQGYLA
jgi:hypothetical protein